MSAPRLTITLFNQDAEALLAHCAEMGDEPALVVRDALKLLYDEHGPRIAEADAAALIGDEITLAERSAIDLACQFADDLAIVKGEMGLPQ